MMASTECVSVGAVSWVVPGPWFICRMVAVIRNIAQSWMRGALTPKQRTACNDQCQQDALHVLCSLVFVPSAVYCPGTLLGGLS